MYIPSYFRINNSEQLVQFIDNNSFATLISMNNDGLCASHLPLQLDEKYEYLYGHFARANEQWKSIAGQEVLVVFHGPHSYISPSWYETSQAVPTWNYVAVHVYGQIELLERDDEIADSLQRLTAKNESVESTYSTERAGSEYIEGLMKAIVGFKIRIARMEGKAKLSQNHSIERHQLVIEQLLRLGDDNSKEISNLMKLNINGMK